MPDAMRTALAVVATLLLVATWAPPSAQSLADVARAEAARRATVQGSGRVITDKDLAPVRPPVDAAASAASPAPRPAADAGVPAEEPEAGSDTGADAEAADPPGPVPEAPERRDEQYWRHRFVATRQAVARAEGELTAVQERLRHLDGELQGGAPADRRNELVQERAAAQSALAALRVRVSNVQGELAALENFARSRSVPADWTR